MRKQTEISWLLPRISESPVIHGIVFVQLDVAGVGRGVVPGHPVLSLSAVYWLKQDIYITSVFTAPLRDSRRWASLGENGFLPGYQKKKKKNG